MALQVWLPLRGDLNNYGLSNITITNSGATIDNNGKIGKCYYFNSTNGSSGATMYIPNFSISNTKFSVCGWFKIVSVVLSGSAEYLICLNNNTYSGDMLFSIAHRNLGLFIIVNNTEYTILTLTANTWYHISLTFSNSVAKVYINGSEVNSRSITSTPYIGSVLNIGSRSSATNGTNHAYYSKIYANDVRIYDHCLSPKEVKEISLGLVLHYKLDSPYTENTTNLSSLGNCSGWNNSGTATRTSNDTSLPDIPEPSGKTVSILENTDGLCAITFGTTTVNVPSKTLTASVWIYISGDVTSSISPYIRSSKTDGNIGNLEYNNISSIGSWPKNTWIRITKTFTTNSEATTVYFCAYIAKTGCKLTFNGWQIEEKDHATPYVNGTRTENIIYDSSGYGNDGTITGTLSITNNTRRYNYSLGFNGSSFIKSNDLNLNNTSNFTISSWINITSSQSYLPIFWLGNGTATQGICVHGPTSNRLEGGNGTNKFDNTLSAINLNSWTHVVITYDGTTIKRYINGVLNGTISFSYLFGNTFVRMYIGYFWGGKFKGNISDIRLYSTTLSAEDILQLYQVNASIDNGGNIISNEFEEEHTSKQQILKTGVVKIDNFLETNDKLKVLSDGSVFLLILHHNAPASNLFTANNCWLNNDTNLYSALIMLKNTSWLLNLAEYEFLVCEKLESSSTENQFRWKLTSNPALASTASGYVRIEGTPNYVNNGLANDASTTHGCMDVSGSDWWGCCGAITRHQSGIPGFNGVVKTGYLDLYVKISNEMIKGNIADFVKFYAKSILTNQLIEK